MKRTMKDSTIKLYKSLRRRKNRIRNRAILMAGFMLALNTFAWFSFIVNGNGNFTADVVSWDIQFFDNEDQIEVLDVKLTDLYPGMTDYKKEIQIINRSDLNAHFSYKIEFFTLYGEEYEVEDYSALLSDDFPFKINFIYPTSDLNAGEQLTFTVSIKWPFESTDTYCKLNALYPYDNNMKYYSLNGSEYEVRALTSDEYITALNEGIYVECDDADSYWGEKSALFKKDHPGANAISLKLKLIVSQKEI